jgi:hypothetical protein
MNAQRMNAQRASCNQVDIGETVRSVVDLFVLRFRNDSGAR